MRLKIVALFLFVVLVGSSSAMKFYFEDSQYSFQLLRALAATAGGGADVGECLKTAYRIKEGPQAHDSSSSTQVALYVVAISWETAANQDSIGSGGEGLRD